MNSNKIPRQIRRATERKLRKIKIIPSEAKLTACRKYLLYEPSS